MVKWPLYFLALHKLHTLDLRFSTESLEIYKMTHKVIHTTNTNLITYSFISFISIHAMIYVSYDIQKPAIEITMKTVIYYTLALQHPSCHHFILKTNAKHPFHIHNVQCARNTQLKHSNVC